LKKTYPTGWRSHIAPIIRAHYNFTCAVCNRSQASLHVHHIDGNASNNSFHNLIPLCGKCHRKAENGQFSFCQHSRGAAEEEANRISQQLERIQKMLRAEGNKPMLQRSNRTRK